MLVTVTYAVACASPSAISWVTIATTLTSTFFGAALAFIANIKIQNRQRENANKAAGNVALAILAKQYGDFIIFKAGLEKETTDRQNFPPWLQLSPTILRFSETLRFDISSLAFLSDLKRPDVIKWLMIADTKYHDLRLLIESNSEACDLRDTNISRSTTAPFGPWDLSHVEAVVGAREKGMLTHFNNFLQQRACEDEQVYRDAAKALTEAMRRFARPDEIMPFGPIGAKSGLEKQD